ncbi:MAG TPA: histidine kinase [Chthoniobacterales bacterium]
MTDSSPARKGVATCRRVLFYFVGWTLIAVTFATVSFAASRSEGNGGFGFVSALEFNVVLFYLWAVLSFAIFWFSRRFPIEVRPLNTRNLLVHIPAIIVLAVGHQAIQLTTLWLALPRLRQLFPTLAACFRSYFGFGFYIDLIIATLIVIGVHALVYYQKFRAGQLEQASLRAQLAQAQLRALKMQLHPHFLFNTLHSISSLVSEDPPKANSMIARLGDFLRLTLDHSDQQLVTLREETEFVRCYLEIEQVRFGDRLTVEFKIDPPTLSAEVPHLILQPIVENAIQHAIAPRAAPGRIEITATRENHSLRLEVKDNGPGITTVHGTPDHHVGLSNVRARLEGLYGNDFTLDMTNRAAQGLVVTVLVPFRSDGSA